MRQDRLADTVETLRKEHGWAAGCVFQYNADEAVPDEFARPAGRRAAYSFVTDRNLALFRGAAVDAAGTTGGIYREHIRDAVSFCVVAK